jgi:diguanylate cyclase (GGDEF)-like protein
MTTHPDPSPILAAQELTAADVDQMLATAWEIRFNDSRQAHALCREALDQSERLGYEKGRATGLLYLSYCEFLLSDYPASQASSEQALELFAALGDAQSRARALNNIGNVRWKLSDTAGAEACYLEALGLLRQLGDRRYEGATLNNLGNLAGDKGDYAESLRYYHEALLRSRESGNPQGEAIALGNMGETHEMLGDLVRALDCHQQSLEIAKRSEDRQGLSSALINIGQIQSKMGDPVGAQEYFEESLKLNRELGNRDGEAQCRFNLGEIEERLGRHDAARACYQEALAIQRAIGDKQSEAKTLNSLGQLHQAMGDLIGALDHFDQSRALAESIGNRHHAAQTRLSYGRLLLAVQGAGPALPHLQQALGDAEAMKSLELQLDCHKALSEAYERQGDTAAALSLLKKANATEKEVYSEAAARRLKQLSVQHQVEQSQQEAEIFRLRNVELAKAYDELAALNQKLQESDLQKSELLAVVQRLAVEDGLTGLANRRQFDTLLRQEFDRAKRFGHPLALAFADIDHFKRVNDRFSHPVGDAVLKQIAQIMRASCRVIDVVARYGGEEFVLLLPETPVSSAIRLCEKIRATVAAHPWSEIHAGLSVTLSLGVADDKGYATPAALLAAADAKLYDAKHGGRDKVCG